MTNRPRISPELAEAIEAALAEGADVTAAVVLHAEPEERR